MYSKFLRELIASTEHKNVEFMRPPNQITDKHRTKNIPTVYQSLQVQQLATILIHRHSKMIRPSKTNLKNFRCTLSIRRLCTSKFGDQIHEPYSKTERTSAHVHNSLQKTSKHTDQRIPFQIA
jgi:hypothetical protein